MLLWRILLTVALLEAAFQVRADIYMHNPRGSNDRNCERTVNRQNGNRLFNSQNNNNGGYACPRAVGDGKFQPESGQAEFSDVDTLTGSVSKFTQNKRIYYYANSILPIEWTNQHGCGVNSQVNCEIVLQYACEDTLDPRVDDFWPWVANKAGPGTAHRGKQHFRDYASTPQNVAAPRDGVPRDSLDSATDTITDNEASAIPNIVETQRFGMQESFDYYDVCQHTERNQGLYTADQLVRRRDRRATRQNPNGNRHGFECQEERDYYPWWAPSPWVDIAVLTDSAQDAVCYPGDTNCSKRCEYYHAHTMNTKPMGYCDVDHSNSTFSVTDKLNSREWKERRWFNNKVACLTQKYTKWYEVKHSDNIDMSGKSSFVCAKTQFARANQLGNARGDAVISQNDVGASVKQDVSEGVNANRFLWTIPNIPTVTKTPASDYFSDMNTAYQSCVLRIRYNISTADYQGWPDSANVNNIAKMVDSRNNSRFEGDPRTPLMQDPYVYIGPGDSADKADKFVSMAVNTNQYGRTFQDRSYVFSIKKLPTENVEGSTKLDQPPVDWQAMTAALAGGGRIYNVNVRGKRGNIVQVYPSVEYDFVPNALALGKNDLIHFQWTGSDYNPRRGCNNGEGGPPDANTFSTDANANLNPRADRSNILFTDSMNHNVPRDYTGYNAADTTLTYAQKAASAKAKVLANAPCYDPSTDGALDGPTATECYAQIMRIGYLNQQRDAGSLVLRAGRPCLTQTEIDTLAKINRDTAEHHPLNCAKMNAKPFPYFDGGLMVMKKWGWYPFFSSRNNNFSNREQIGIICVGGGGVTCDVTEDKVLQDQNPGITGRAAMVKSTCIDTANGDKGANANGATSCIGSIDIGTGGIDAKILRVETQAINEGDNDNKGDGNMYGCAVQSNFATAADLAQNTEGLTAEQQAGLAVGLVALGIFLAWGAYWVYYRYNPIDSSESKFKSDMSWLKRNPNRNMTSNTNRYARADAGAWMQPETEEVELPTTVGAPPAGRVPTYFYKDKDAVDTARPLSTENIKVSRKQPAPPPPAAARDRSDFL